MAAGFTPNECKLFRELCDGKPHEQGELAKLFDDGEVGTDKRSMLNCMNVCLCSIRKKLRRNGQDISTEKAFNKTYYRLVRLVGSSYR